MSRDGKPMYRRCELDYWYYWLDGKQGHCNGHVLAASLRGAKRLIHEKHPGGTIDRVMSYDEYHDLHPGPGMRMEAT